MIKRIKSILKPEGLDKVSTPKDKKIEFILAYQDKHVGTLLLASGEWIFEYSTWFKAAKFMQPLVDFPDVTKIYRSDELWPFYSARIPGIGQPQVEKIIEEEGIDENDISALLRRFGSKSISNPYTLRAA